MDKARQSVSSNESPKARVDHSDENPHFSNMPRQLLRTPITRMKTGAKEILELRCTREHAPVCCFWACHRLAICLSTYRCSPGAVVCSFSSRGLRGYADAPVLFCALVGRISVVLPRTVIKGHYAHGKGLTHAHMTSEACANSRLFFFSSHVRPRKQKSGVR